jgi:thymidylate kinase
MYAVSIDKETINTMPRVSFQGRIHVIDAMKSRDDVTDAIMEVLKDAIE